MKKWRDESESKDRFHILVRAFQDREWMYEALCRGRASLYFVDRNSDNRSLGLTAQERKAKALCARCPVRRKCLEYGLDEDYGVWAGTLPSERKQGGLSRGVGNGRRARTDIDALLDEMSEQAVRLGLVERAS